MANFWFSWNMTSSSTQHLVRFHILPRRIQMVLKMWVRNKRSAPGAPSCLTQILTTSMWWRFASCLTLMHSLLSNLPRSAFSSKFSLRFDVDESCWLISAKELPWSISSASFCSERLSMIPVSALLMIFVASRRFILIKNPVSLVFRNPEEASQYWKTRKISCGRGGQIRKFLWARAGAIVEIKISCGRRIWNVLRARAGAGAKTL